MRVIDRYNRLYMEKGQTLTIMREITKYLDPEDSNMSREEATNTEEVVFDTTGRNALENYTFESLSDVINPYEAWFNLEYKNIDDRPQDEMDEIKQWADKATKQLFIFINDSDYYPHLITDKKNYDLYGFSGLSILKAADRVQIRAENPYNLVLSRDCMDDKVSEYYWTTKTSAYTVHANYGMAKNKLPYDNSTRVVLLHALVPNNEFFIDMPEKGKGKYVYAVFFAGTEAEFMERQQNQRYRTALVSKGSMVEELRRLYFDKPFLVCPRDTLGYGRPYGTGIGKRILVASQNVNQIRKNTLQLSALSAEPPVQYPFDIFSRFKYDELQLNPGSIFPLSSSGEQIVPVDLRIDMQKQLVLLQYEDAKLAQDIPQLSPEQKKARQSQFEVSQQQQQASEIQLMYKLFYLRYAVGKHLDLLFDCAMDLKKISPLPNGVKKKDFRVSMADILLRLYKKVKAQAYVRSQQMCAGYFTNNPSTLDNVDGDMVVRNVYRAQGSGDVLLSKEETARIRQERQQQQQQQQQIQQQLLNQQQNQVGADAALKGAQAQKALKEAQGE